MPLEKMIQVGFRFPETLLTRLDVQVDRANDAHPGRKFSRADLVRGFLIEALDLAETREALKEKTGRRKSGS